MASFTPGREYHFTLSDGRNLVLRFVGLVGQKEITETFRR